MRKMIVSLMVLMLVIGCQQAVQEVDVEKEKAAIKGVIEKLFTEYWNKKSFEGYASTMMHAPYTQSIWAGQGSYTETVGWDKFAIDRKKWLQENPEPTNRVPDRRKIGGLVLGFQSQPVRFDD
ncbi:hypothetical protein BVY01_02630 [bacterium I07]|nr:hypothetical protein BVY01_02630 [bacterium I07]